MSRDPKFMIFEKLIMGIFVFSALPVPNLSPMKLIIRNMIWWIFKYWIHLISAFIVLKCVANTIRNMVEAPPLSKQGRVCPVKSEASAHMWSKHSWWSSLHCLWVIVSLTKMQRDFLYLEMNIEEKKSCFFSFILFPL